MNPKCPSVAVVGAGIAGAAVARALALAGHSVHVFDKARAPGGRLATRRVEWVDRQGQGASARLDHGAPGFTAVHPAFQAFVDLALAAGWLAEWRPRLAPGSLALEGGAPLYIAAADSPALCRHLLEGVPVSLSFAVDGLQRGPLGWQVQGGGVRHASAFDAVVLALPPAQAAPLLHPHRPDWARHAATALMQPCWTLMGIAEDPGPGPAWDLARPRSGPLAWVMRNDARPGRAAAPGLAQWVAHARAGWSRENLEQPASWVLQHLQAALGEHLGRPVDWQHATVHRWRYAWPQAQGTAPAASCWWDAGQGLGVCGDFLGACGSNGVEGAWRSAQALTAALLQSASEGAGVSAPRAQVQAHDPAPTQAQARAQAEADPASAAQARRRSEVGPSTPSAPGQAGADRAPDPGSPLAEAGGCGRVPHAGEAGMDAPVNCEGPR
ncbi:MAG: NAD(P)-binding protein [Burkholderiales bacterium]|nr:NAD(P)-binding protein [Burkholderiales bacterium]